jgi:hypothetical protein
VLTNQRDQLQAIDKKQNTTDSILFKNVESTTTIINSKLSWSSHTGLNFGIVLVLWIITWIRNRSRMTLLVCMTLLEIKLLDSLLETPKQVIEIVYLVVIFVHSTLLHKLVRKDFLLQ